MAMTSRRDAVLALGASALGWLDTSSAQVAPRRIGFLAAESASDPSQARRLAVLESALAQLGYLLGRDVVIDARWAT